MSFGDLFFRLLRWLRLQIFMIRERDCDFDKMGVRYDPPQKAGLVHIVDVFRRGYNLTLADDDLDTLTPRMTAAFDPVVRAFAHEGTGMALTLCDWFDDRKRVETFLKKSPACYDSMLMLGVGFALARLPWVSGGVSNYLKRFSPGFDGLIMNGYGFHEGVFKTYGDIEKAPRPRMSPEALRCFDHGLGRAMWFMCGASPKRIGEAFAKIPVVRHQDLWAGLGTAVCFAGRAYPDFVEYDGILSQMSAMAGEANRGPFMLGVSLAAVLQYRSNDYTRWVQRACEVLLDMSATEAGALADRTWNECVAIADLASTPFANYQRAGDTIIAALTSRKLQRS